MAEATVLALILVAIYAGPLISGGTSAPAPVATPYDGPLLDVSAADVTSILEQERMGGFVFTPLRTSGPDGIVSGESEVSGTIVDLSGPAWNLREIQVYLRPGDGELETWARRDLTLVLALYAPDALAPLQVALDSALAGNGSVVAQATSGRILASLEGDVRLGATLTLTLSVAPGVQP